MNICFISKELAPFFTGGIGVQFRLLMLLFREQGHAIRFLTRRPPQLPPDWQQHFPGINVEFVTDAETQLPRPYALSYSMLVADAVGRLASDGFIDLILAAEFEAEIFSLLFRPPVNRDGREIPIILTLHGPSTEILHHNGKSSSVDDALVCAMEDAVIRHSRILVAPSQTLWSELSRRLKLHYQCQIIPNLCDRSVFTTERDNIAPDRRSIVYVGRLQRVKGVDILVDAFSSVLKKGIDCELVLIGKDLDWPEYGDTFTAHCRRTLPPQVLERIRFCGPLWPTDVAAELGRAWVAVFPSRWEAFGIAALEALSAGVPAIVSQETGLSEVTGPNYPLNVSFSQGAEAIVEQLATILRDPALRERLSEEGKLRGAELDRVARAHWVALLTNVTLCMDMASQESLASVAPLLLAFCAHLEETSRVLQTRTNELRERDRELSHISDRLNALHSEVLIRDQLILERDSEALIRDQLIVERDARIDSEAREIAAVTVALASRDANIKDLEEAIAVMRLEAERNEVARSALVAKLFALQHHWLVRAGSGLKIIKD